MTHAFHLHRALGAADPDSPDWKSLFSSAYVAQKFDFGDITNVTDAASKMEEGCVPYENTIVQCTNEQYNIIVHIINNGKSCNASVYVGYRDSICGYESKWACLGHTRFEWKHDEVSIIIDGQPQIHQNSSIKAKLGEYFSGNINSEYYRPMTVFWFSVSVLGALHALSCANVKTEDHAAPKFINSKRVAKGKLPFFSYKTLHLAWEVNDKGEPQGGSHASPRLHFRRAHMRTLADGRRVMVQQCLVGDKSKGIITKEYAVAPRSAIAGE